MYSSHTTGKHFGSRASLVARQIMKVLFDDWAKGIILTIFRLADNMLSGASLAKPSQRQPANDLGATPSRLSREGFFVDFVPWFL